MTKKMDKPPKRDTIMNLKANVSENGLDSVTWLILRYRYPEIYCQVLYTSS